MVKFWALIVKFWCLKYVDRLSLSACDSFQFAALSPSSCGRFAHQAWEDFCTHQQHGWACGLTAATLHNYKICFVIFSHTHFVRVLISCQDGAVNLWSILKKTAFLHCEQGWQAQDYFINMLVFGWKSRSIPFKIALLYFILCMYYFTTSYSKVQQGSEQAGAQNLVPGYAPVGVSVWRLAELVFLFPSISPPPLLFYLHCLETRQQTQFWLLWCILATCRTYEVVGWFNRCSWIN